MSTRTSRPPTRTTSRGTSRPPSRTGTATTTRTSESQEDWIAAILEGRGVGREVGVVAIERELGKVVITQYSDTPAFVKTLHLLTTRPPSLILVPSSSLANGNSVLPGRGGEEEPGRVGAKGEATILVRSLQEAWKGVTMIGVQRKFWNEQSGFEFISQLIIHNDERVGTITSATSKFYALSAACALFKYLENAHSIVFSPRSLRITYAALEGNCLIDSDTAMNLELVSNLLNKNSKQHLHGLLNHCYTPMGSRLLRTNILSPLTHITVIDSRLDAIEELLDSEERFHALRKSLEPLRSLDLDLLIGQIIASRPGATRRTSADPSRESEAKITRILHLRTFLHALPALRAAVQGSNSLLLRRVGEILGDERSEEMREAIRGTINEDAVTGLQKGSLATRSTRIYAIRAERKLLLDVARETYKENLSDAFELAEEMKDKYGIEMSMDYSGSGCIFSCSKAEMEGKEMPRVFTNVNKKAKKIEFSSMDLKKKNSRIQESVQEIFLMSDEILDELFEEIRTGIACLYHCAEAIAMVDMLSAFADVSSKNNYVRPEWTDTLAIKAGRHPLHEHFRLSDGSFVPNDTYASDSASFQIVGGSNMSGKSTLLRQIALMQIMAQIGCYVPATYASFRVVDALLSRLGNDDSIEASLSTFSKEMSTMAMIVSAMGTCKQCLIIVDELGRGTSPAEGVGIAHALAESIIRAKAICFFATHFKELSVTLGRYPNVVSLYLDTEVDRSQPDYSLTFHHRVLDGTTPLTHYGLELAKLAKLPSDVLDKASIVSATLESLAEQGRAGAQSTKLSIRRREVLRLKTSLKDLYHSKGLSPDDLAAALRDLQADAVRNLCATMSDTAPSSTRGTREELQDETPLWDPKVDADAASSSGEGGKGDLMEGVRGGTCEESRGEEGGELAREVGGAGEGVLREQKGEEEDETLDFD